MSLESYRKHIDNIDHHILHLLHKRFEIARHIAKIKKREAEKEGRRVKIKDRKRETQVLRSRSNLAARYKISTRLCRRLFTLILRESRAEQKRVI